MLVGLDEVLGMSLRSNSQDADAAETCVGVRASLWSFRRWIRGTPRVRTAFSVTFQLGHGCLSSVKGPPFGLDLGPLPNFSRMPISSSAYMPRCDCLSGSICLCTGENHASGETSNIPFTCPYEVHEFVKSRRQWLRRFVFLV